MGILWGMYVIVDIMMSCIAIHREKKYWYYFLLPVIFLSLHLAYGIGTLAGIVEMPFWKKRIYESKNNEKKK